MNELIQKLAEKAGLDVKTMGFENNQYQHDPWNARLSKFTQLIVRECMRMCDVAAVGYETHGHMKEANGCSSAKEYIEEHFGLEERTASQKMADAGYTRRPKGWTKEGEE